MSGTELVFQEAFCDQKGVLTQSPDRDLGSQPPQLRRTEIL